MRHKSPPALLEFFHSLPPDKGGGSPSPLPFSFFFLSISPFSPSLFELHGARNFAGNSELSRNRCSTKTRKKYRYPARIVARSVSSYPAPFVFLFFFFFLFSIILFSLSPIFVAMEGRIAESGGVSRINTCA